MHPGAESTDVPSALSAQRERSSRLRRPTCARPLAFRQDCLTQLDLRPRFGPGSPFRIASKKNRRENFATAELALKAWLLLAEVWRT